MKRFKLDTISWAKKIAAMLMAAIGLLSCSDEILVEGKVADGTPIMVNFQYSMPVQDLVISTRAMSDETANRVENIYILGFKGGKRAFGFYYDSELAGGTKTTLTSKTKVPAGTYEIYAIANTNSDVYGIDENTDNTTNTTNLRSFLDNVSTKDELLNKTVSILTSARNLDRSGTSLLMAGALCDDKGNAKSCTINTNDQTVKTVNLKRLDSEITFNFKEGSDIAFTAKRWYVVNAPAKSFLFEQTADAVTSDKDFFHTYKVKDEDRNPVYDNTFTFYMPENKKTAKKEGVNTYYDREKEIKNGDGLHDIDPNTQRRNYEYAPDNGTYVVVTGHYEGPTSISAVIGETQNVVAEVQYIIHLGFVNKIANDFFSKRNIKYTYNVTVSGIDNIIVEVESGTENQSGAVGDVIWGGSDNVYTLDAHYEAVLLSFDYEELVTAYGDGSIKDLFTSVVNTPYTAMLATDEAKKEDQQWVKVIKNRDASEDFQAYYKIKNKLQSVQEMLDELKQAIIDGNTSMFTFKDGKYVVTYTCFIDEFYYEEKDLPSDVRGRLLDNTNIWKSFVNTPNRKLYIICYRKESPDQESSIISSKYVISQRSIQTFYSTEPTPGQKEVAYGIETLNETGNLFARPYEARPADMDCGWGNFAENVRYFNWDNLYDAQNGYKNLEMNKKVNKNGNLNPEKRAIDKSDYLQAVREEYNSAIGETAMSLTNACLQRNRRETTSSSSAIDKKDVKWYLPAINQYQSFYLGEPAISQEARLFNYPAYNPIISTSYQFIKHYAASNYTQRNDKFSFHVFWAEEATSVSTMSQQISWSETGGSSNVPETNLLRRRELSYRCMRNLGSDGSEDDGRYDSYQTLRVNGSGRSEFHVDKLNPLLKSRSRATGELGTHFYADKANHFYVNGFEVANNCNGLITTLERATGVETKGGTGCEALNAKLPAGEARWRVPNLRELTLMWQKNVLNDIDDRNPDRGIATSRTQMSYKYSGNVWYRKGWTVTSPRAGGSPNLGMSSDTNHSTTVRCVRDLK